MPAIAGQRTQFSALWLETADTNEAKELAAFCRKFRLPLETAMQRSELLNEQRPGQPRLHLFFQTSAAVSIGVSHPGNSSPWPMGIPRLRLPPQAPSRSTLKLGEALQLWLSPRRRLRCCMRVSPLSTSAPRPAAGPGNWCAAASR
jgi:23S rRNA (cytidine2498-2'-O)-methyltransferase